MTALTIAPSKINGQGVFALAIVKKGMVVLSFPKEKMNWLEIKRRFGQEYLDHCLEVDDDTDAMVEPDTPAWYVNHSCAPNSGINGHSLVAMRDIAEGEEITFDYSMSLATEYWTMRCNCGSPGCRGLISSFYTLPKAIQERYLPWASDHIKRKAAMEIWG